MPGNRWERNSEGLGCKAMQVSGGRVELETLKQELGSAAVKVVL